jgi:hypothetical protein
VRTNNEMHGKDRGLMPHGSRGEHKNTESRSARDGSKLASDRR